MTSPGGRIEIRVDPDLRGFSNRLGSGLESSARSGVARFAAATKAALTVAAVGIGVAGVAAARSTLNLGIEYEAQLNTLRAVSNATEEQMKAVGQTAKELGSDLTLPATSAADAAAVMTELAKANFSVQEAQDAAKGSLQLAAAAQIDGARAAEIQANAINAYGLEASDAARVADVLANAANASSAEITDVADALSQASAVAANAKISIEDTATVLGILANNGIKGSDAGTLLKSALLAVQSPSKQARDAMADLNLTAYDAQGNFVGLRAIFEQLQTAQGRMTQQQYEMATSTLFGSDAARLAGIAAKEGGEGFDQMAAAIGRQGAAADVAAAKAQGLGGAIEAFKSQVETVQIDVFERAAPSLERLVRAAADRLPEVADRALATADEVVGHFQEMAPRIGQAMQARREAVASAWRELGQPLVDGARDLVDRGLDVAVDGVERLGELAGKAVDTVEPLAKSVGELASELAEADGPLAAVGGGLEVAADAAELALDAVGPLVSLASKAAGAFGAMPGPLQTAALALVAFRVAGRRAGDWATTGLTGRMTAPFTTFGQTVRMQMALADSSITRSQAFRGGIATALDRQVPAVTGSINQITGAYRGGIAEFNRRTAQYGLAVDGFASRVHGLSRAAQTAGSVGIRGLQSAGAGLVGFLGGPWGVAMAGAAAGVALLSSAQQNATQTGQRWAEQLRAGGAAAEEARRQMQVYRDELAGQGAGENKGVDFGWDRFVSDLKVDLGITSRALEEAEEASRSYWNSLTPVEQATSKVAEWTNTYATRLRTLGRGHEDTRIAQERLAHWTSVLSFRQRELDGAMQSVNARMSEQTRQALEAANTDLAWRGQQNQLEQQIQRTADAVNRYGVESAEGRAALLQLEQQTMATAESARQHAIAVNQSRGAEEAATAGDAAYLAQLMITAQQLGVYTPAAIQQTIAKLQGTTDAGQVAAAAFQQLGLEVQNVPNSKTVIVSSTTPEQIALLETLGFRVTTLPDGRVEVVALTADAEAAIDRVARNRTATITVNTVQTGDVQPRAGVNVRRAGGGWIYGPGTGTSDSILMYGSNGEFMVRQRVASQAPAGMEALNRGDWATAAEEFGALAARQSQAQLAELAGSRAAAAAGHYAAGGFVSRGVAAPPVLVSVGDHKTVVQLDSRVIRTIAREEAGAVIASGNAKVSRKVRSRR
ncbi:phage tail tape measure protein [Blastococcus sp. CCUG 61487]|uniref:phage tail tape measure protein n=1 Tax=Blastococcus sp. CCUG 61487 TaxID=1840703 RepID=UPI0010C1015F|nr:phage tail tape measure protein [Blastococcus sp. CCUG 61487]TKJ25216.1 hypothetical protein A6V29_04125 [Blastococcus sp. CCUG 61487]